MGQKAVLKEYEVAEAEAAELHEFLQAEKITLNEALKESEQEVEDLKKKVNSAEERCGQVVRLREQRHQEALALEAQLNGVEERAKEMILAQDKEISQSTLNITEIEAKLKDFFLILYPAIYKTEYSLSNGIDSNQIIDSTPTLENGSSALNDELFPNSDILTPDQMNSSYDNCIRNGNIGDDDISIPSKVNGDVSLQNLSNAIKNRKKISESNSSPGSCSQKSKSSLLSSISKVDGIIKKLLEINRNVELKRSNLNEAGSHPNTKIQIEPDFTNEEASDANKRHEEEIAELKAKFLRHKEILKSNCDQAESEVVRLDEIYHDTVDRVLKAFNSIPVIVESNPELLKIKKSLESSLLEAQQEAASEQNNLDIVVTRLPSKENGHN